MQQYWQQSNAVTQLHDQCRNGNATKHSMLEVKLHFTVNNVTILSVTEKCFYGVFLAGNNTKNLGARCACQILTKLVISVHVSLKSTISNSTEIRPVRAMLIHAGG